MTHYVILARLILCHFTQIYVTRFTANFNVGYEYYLTNYLLSIDAYDANNNILCNESVGINSYLVVVDIPQL